MSTAEEIIQQYIDLTFDNYNHQRYCEYELLEFLSLKFDLKDYFILYRAITDKIPEKYLSIEKDVEENYERDLNHIKENSKWLWKPFFAQIPISIIQIF